jgi:hypothetical protein
MQRSASYVAAMTVILTGLFGGSAPTAAAEPHNMTATDVRLQFTDCGFEIGNPQARAGNGYIVVRDPGMANGRDADQRILMAIVYPDEAAAVTAHQRAHRAAEERLGERWPFSDDHGPQLLAGYGGSVWRANVALVQSSSRTLASMWSVDGQTDEARVARPELFELGFVSSLTDYGVDRDFVGCLDETPLADAAPPAAQPDIDPASVAPTFFRGRPW